MVIRIERQLGRRHTVMGEDLEEITIPPAPHGAVTVRPRLDVIPAGVVGEALHRAAWNRLLSSGVWGTGLSALPTA
jgi:hypothetical protein